MWAPDFDDIVKTRYILGEVYLYTAKFLEIDKTYWRPSLLVYISTFFPAHNKTKVLKFFKI